MEGSAAVAPAAADANGQVQAPEAPAADPTQVTQPQEQAPEADSVEARLAAAEKRAQEAEAKLAETAQEGPQDLLSALEGVDVALTPEDLAAQQAEESGQEGEVDDAQVKEFEGWLKEQIQESLTPLQEERADEQVRAWQDKHPDATPNSELGKKLLATIQSLASQYGPGAAKDPAVLNLAYAAAKAELADAGAVPAEQAAENGASLETQPGGSQTGDPTDEEQYKQSVYGSAAGAARGSGFR